MKVDWAYPVRYGTSLSLSLSDNQGQGQRRRRHAPVYLRLISPRLPRLREGTSKRESRPGSAALSLSLSLSLPATQTYAIDVHYAGG